MFSVKIITSYPEMFPGTLGYSVIGSALNEKKWFLETINLHDFGYDERNSIDDIPFGGGPGMIIRPDVVEKAVNFITKNSNKRSHLIYMSPSGKPLKQSDLIDKKTDRHTKIFDSLESLKKDKYTNDWDQETTSIK